MNRERMEELKNVYSKGLLEDTLPFWIENSVDREDGGFLFCLDRDGTVMDTDKPMWIEGRTLRRRRYLSTEFFAVMALAAYGQATGDRKILQQAEELFSLTIRYASTPGLLEPKVNPETRPSRKLGLPMIMIGTAQVLREATGSAAYTAVINERIDEIERFFVNREHRYVLEFTGPNGEFLDHFDGRLVTPGHGIEAAWFILHEARLRDKDEKLTELGCLMLDWMWKIGWDREYGGISYFKDARDLPVSEYWHDMKFWWPQNEAIIATLLAYHLTGKEKYARWHALVHDWAHEKFPDPEYGEWYGYLHRDGRLSNTLKGTMFKGPFHLPRMQHYCWKLLETMLMQS